MAEGTAEAAELEGEPARAMRRPQLGGRPPPALRLTYSEPSLARTCPFTPPPPRLLHVNQVRCGPARESWGRGVVSPAG